jgi:hypothetical protein
VRAGEPAAGLTCGAVVFVACRRREAWPGAAPARSASGVALAALVTDPRFATLSGKYFDRGEEAKSSPLSYNQDNARELWQSSMALSGLTAPETIFTSSPTR